MARAKRTDRSEARRRYRTALAETSADQPEAAEAESAATSGTAPALRRRGGGGPATSGGATSGGGASPGGGAAPRAQGRPGVLGTFRAAARPVDLRSDLAYLPDLVVHTRAVWIPSLAVAASGVVILAVPSNSISSLLGQIFVAPPSLAGPFLAGLLAPRATYLAGGIVGLVAALVLTVAILLAPASLVSAANVDRWSIILYAIVVSPLFGLAVGGFAGYYRRFLFLSNPNAQRRAAARQGKPGAKRRQG